MKAICDFCGREHMRYMGISPCSKCLRIFNRLKGRAHSAVAAAIKAGQLASPKSKQCVDCGDPADRYDHRYYSRPLEVDAVCHSCDWHRGPSKDWKRMLSKELVREQQP